MPVRSWPAAPKQSGPRQSRAALPGWTWSAEKTTLAKPIKAEGSEITEAVSKLAEARILNMPGVRYVNTLGGYTFLEDADQPNATTLIVELVPGVVIVLSVRTRGEGKPQPMERTADR